jgi:ribosomal-protein-alanine N-acetyltransferase
LTTHILRADSLDAPAMARVHKTGFAHPWDEGALRNLMDKPNCLTLAAFESPRELVGFIMTRQADKECEILTIISNNKKRRSGIATALLTHAFELSRQNNTDHMFLEVASGNKAAIALYKKHGFKEISRRKGYYQQGRNTPEDALVMSKQLGGS